MTDRLGDLEEAVSALGRGDPDAARTAIARAFEADHSLGHVVDAVVMACAHIEEHGELSPGIWDALADACPPEILPAVEAWRR